MRIALKSHIKTYIISKYPEVVIGGEIEDLAKNLEYSASNALRRCRELENEGIIAAEYYRGSRGEKLVKYRYKLPESEVKALKAFREAGRIKIEIREVNGERKAVEIIQ